MKNTITGDLQPPLTAWLFVSHYFDINMPTYSTSEDKVKVFYAIKTFVYLVSVNSWR